MRRVPNARRCSSVCCHKYMGAFFFRLGSGRPRFPETARTRERVNEVSDSRGEAVTRTHISLFNKDSSSGSGTRSCSGTGDLGVSE
jgi:hypothetical protein